MNAPVLDSCPQHLNRMLNFFQILFYENIILEFRRFVVFLS